MLPKWNDEVISVFKSDVHERKQLTYGSKHKKNGSKSKKCTLPSDYLSKKEKEKMNGEVKKYVIGKPIDAETFESYPADIKQEYIITACSYYQVTCYALAGALTINGYRFDEIVHSDNLDVNTKLPNSPRTQSLNKQFAEIAKNQYEKLKTDIHTGKLIPLTWSVAKCMTVRSLVNYINRLQIIYEVPISMIAHMMCTTRQNILGYIKHHGLILESLPHSKHNYDLFIRWAASNGELDPNEQEFVDNRDPIYTPGIYVIKEEDILAVKKKLEEEKDVAETEPVEVYQTYTAPITGHTTINGSIDDVIEFLNRYKGVIDMKEVSVTIEF